MAEVKYTPTGRISKAKSTNTTLFGKSNSKLPAAFRGHKITLTMEEFMEMIRLLPSKAERAFLQYSVALQDRAFTIFQQSFDKKMFYSRGEQKWAPISDTTWKLRKWHYIHYREIKRLSPRSEILKETGWLRRSIEKKAEPTSAGIYRRTIWTNPEAFDRSPVHKGYIYAGIHNNPESLSLSRHIPRRQFMGHSTFMDSFIQRYGDRYLFGEIFNVPGGGV